MSRPVLRLTPCECLCPADDKWRTSRFCVAPSLWTKRPFASCPNLPQNQQVPARITSLGSSASHRPQIDCIAEACDLYLTYATANSQSAFSALTLMLQHLHFHSVSGEKSPKHLLVFTHKTRQLSVVNHEVSLWGSCTNQMLWSMPTLHLATYKVISYPQTHFQCLNEVRADLPELRRAPVTHIV